MIYPDLQDVPIEVYGGYTPAIPPADLPPGASPFCQDVVFPEGSVTTRGGLALQYTLANNPTVNGLKTYLTPTLAQRLMVWDSLGNLYKESPQGTLNLLASRPYTNLFYQSSTLFGREYEAFFNSLGGFDIPRQYDDTYFDRVSHSGPGASPVATDSGAAGNIAAGKHQVSVAFINRQGWISMASVPPTTWTAAGVKQVALTVIPTGPSNIVARLVLFTPVITAPAVTGSFFSLPTGTGQLVTPTVMLINDNITTALTVDFTDAILIAGFQANFLFTQIELGECAFSAGFSSRQLWMGERNRQQNFINLGFDGGFGVAGSSPASANSGPNNPTVAASVGLGTAWVNPANVFVQDGVAATAVLPADSSSAYIKATGYGFAIPATATITGIVVTARVKGSTINQVCDNSIFLVKNGAIVGVDHANGNLWSAAFANQVYGSSADLWSATWTPAEINGAAFGVEYSALNTNTSLGRTASVDWLGITVYYGTPVAGATVGPWGWTQGASYAGGSSALTSGFTADYGDAFAITGDGVAAVRGLITQSAAADWLLQPIIARNTAYRVRARIASANGLLQGTLHVNLQSTTGGFTTGGLAVQASKAGANYVEFDALLTAAIIAPPADLLLQVYADGTPTNGGAFLIDSIEIYPANAPFNYSTVRFSHSFNPESYDSVTGQIQVRPNDGQQLRAGFPIRNDYYIAKDHFLCKTTDDGVNEPASWGLTDVSATVGICGPNAVDWTEEWAAFAERSGLYIIWGGDPVKITPEIQEDASRTGKIVWNSINWVYGHTVWVRIDRINKRILVGAPVNGATSPNVVFVLDYKWLDTAQDIANSPMVTYSAFTGKILSHGRGRRWTYWNITSNSMAFAERSDGTLAAFFGSGVANGNIYQQGAEAVQLSDNGSAIHSLYDTYYSPSSIEEEIKKLSAHRKLLGYIKWRAVGAGNLLLSVQVANRVTNLRSYALSLFPAADGGRGLNLHGERFSIRVETNAAGAWFQLEKLIPCMKKDAAIPVRGTNA